MFSNTQIFCSVTLYCIIFNVFIPSSAVELVFYENSNHEGISFTIDIPGGTCYVMPSAWNNRVSSLLTPSDMCLDLFDNADCTGKWKHYRASSYRMFVDFGGTEYNDYISSLGMSPRGVNGCETI